MGIRRRWKRTDLFLVRVWRDLGNRGRSGLSGTATGTASGEGQADRGAGQAWHGQVRRVSNGESRQFDNLHALLNELTDMLGESGADAGDTGQE